MQGSTSGAVLSDAALMAGLAADLDEVYRIVDELDHAVGGARQLGNAARSDGWPDLGVYLVLEPGEQRRRGRGQRIVRVGTHALKAGAKSTLWGRLSQHRGRGPAGGSHRSSVFRKHVGGALLAHDGPQPGTEQWGVGGSAPREVRSRERAHEVRVNAVIGAMTVLWLDIDDEPGPDSERGSIERNLIALLAAAHRDGLERPSRQWLGLHAPSPAIGSSGLWNVNHTDRPYDPAVVEALEDYAAYTAGR